MSKSWLTLIIIATVTVLMWTGFQFYIAISGQANQDFDYEVVPITGDIPVSILENVGPKKDKIIVKLDEIQKPSENTADEAVDEI